MLGEGLALISLVISVLCQLDPRSIEGVQAVPPSLFWYALTPTLIGYRVLCGNFGPQLFRHANDVTSPALEILYETFTHQNMNLNVFTIHSGFRVCHFTTYEVSTSTHIYCYWVTSASQVKHNNITP